MTWPASRNTQQSEFSRMQDEATYGDPDMVHRDPALYGCARCRRYVPLAQIRTARENPAALICVECHETENGKKTA